MMLKKYLPAAAALICALSLTAHAENVFVENNSMAVFSGKDNQGYIGVIRDGNIPDRDNTREQYIAYADADGRAYIGYEFRETMSANTVIYSPGAADETGGWFADGSVRIEALIGGVWTDTGAYSTPEYPNISAGGEIVLEREYVFNFKPVNAEGIRIVGTAGGSDGYISASELSVLCDIDLGGYASLTEYLKAEGSVNEVWIEGVSKPIAEVTDPDVSGGSHNLGDINDGYIPKVGDSYSKQYDTVSSAGKKSPDHTEYIGYLFDKPHKVELLEFTEGGNFVDGGWFEGGSMKVEVYRDYQWTEVGFTSLPEYPNSDSQSDFLPDFETYTLMLDEPCECGGIRISGIAGGSANFISCGELRVKEYTEPKVKETPVEQDEQPTDESEKNDGGSGVNPLVIAVPAVCVIAAAAVIIIAKSGKRRLS